MGSIIYETKINVELTPPPNKTRDYQTSESRDSRSETNGCARNLDDKHKNEEDEDYIDPPYKKR